MEADLITVESAGRMPLWRHYQLTGLITPSVLAMQRSFEGATSVRYEPLLKPFWEATDLLNLLASPLPTRPTTAK
jgi:hypothetical protein